MAGGQPPRLEWRSGEPRSGACNEARQVCGLHPGTGSATFHLRNKVSVGGER